MSEKKQTILERFIGLLSQELTPLPPSEREKIIDQYTSHFDQCKAAGMSDEAILGRLDDPVNLGRAYAASAGAMPAASWSSSTASAYGPPVYTVVKPYRSAGAAVGSAIGLGFLSIVFVYPVLLPFTIAMLAAVLAGGIGIVASAVSLLSFVITPLQYFVSLPNYPVMANFLICLGTGSACIALTIAFKSIFRTSVLWVSRYSQWVFRKIKGE